MNDITLTPEQSEMRKHVCHPLDDIFYLRKKDAPEGKMSIEERVVELAQVVAIFKVGKGSFTRFGPEVIEIVRDHGAELFLDLKYHDIPNTVGDASEAAIQQKANIFNVHASGGPQMLEESVKRVKAAKEKYGMPDSKVVGVTVLTSLGPADYLWIHKTLVPGLTFEDLQPYFGPKGNRGDKGYQFARMLENKGYQNLVSFTNGPHCNVIEQQVLHLAQLSYNAGLDGIVCAAADLPAINSSLPENFIKITPGIEGPSTKAGADQARVLTPGLAIKYGATILVIGRALKTGNTAEERQQNGLDILNDMVINSK